MSAGGAADPSGALVERLQRELRTVAALEVHPLIHPSTPGIASTPNTPFNSCTSGTLDTPMLHPFPDPSGALVGRQQRQLHTVAALEVCGVFPMHVV